jgi:outer membrane lipoprotein carrier protein
MKTVIFLLFAIFAYAVEIDANSFEASFTQTVKNEQGKSFKYSGQIVAKKPNFALWTYIKPFKKEIFIKGKQVTVYEPNLAQATVSENANVPNIYELAKKAKQVSQDEYEAVYDGVKIYFKLNSGAPEKIYYKDKIDNNIEIVFSNMKKNQPINDKIFDFIAPSGTDIIKQ